MIIDQTPLTLAEVSQLVGDSEKSKKIKEFIAEFYKLKPTQAKELKDELKALNLIKLKDEHIVSLVNFIPGDAVELNKILSDVSLDQEEVNKILEVTKKY